MSQSVITIGDWVVDRDTNSICREEESRKLQPLSIDVLLYLAEHSDRIVSNQELLDALWSRRFVGDDAVHRRIANLRKALGDSSRNPAYIRTVSKRGYRLIAGVGHPAATRVPWRARRRLATKAVAGLLVIVTLFVVVQTQRSVEKRSLRPSTIASSESLFAGDQSPAAFVELAPFDDERGADLAALVEALTHPVSICDGPPGVELAYRFVSQDSEWTSLGVTLSTDLTSLLEKRCSRAGSDERCRSQPDAGTPGCPSMYSFRDAAAVPARP